ncbi:AAA family ATPase [Sphaerisporangium sp. NPDC005288]|uniref:AAA family ATPase n=1 Tax=Sphaerisporangium sp. NPDC005288 TaxID=3155114 RepID=UPI0033BB8E6A
MQGRAADGGGGQDRSPGGGSLLLRILGPLRLWRDGAELDAGPRQRAFLLAVLLARVGRPTGTDELIDLIWDDDPPDGARNLIQKYVGGVRRLLEPARSARTSGSYVRRRGDAYLFTAGAGVLDLVEFRDLATAAGTALAKERHEDALDTYVKALGLWQGPAGEGLREGPTASSIFARLDGEFFDACTAAAELAVSLGRPQGVLPGLYRAAAMAPLHEPVQASLISTLGAAGRQAEALSVFEAVRTRLAADLGISPCQALEAAYWRVLDQDLQAAGAVTLQPAAPHAPASSRAAAESQAPSGSGLVGRSDELTVLRQAIDPAFAGGTGLVVLVGEPGIGKTHLLREIAAEAVRRDAGVVWGHCLHGEGTPSMWPWIQVVGRVLDEMPGSARAQWLAGELGHLLGPGGDGPGGSAAPGGTARFRLFEAVAAAVGQVAARRPLVLVIDDLQWADAASLDLFSHLAVHLPAGTVIIGALRDRAPVPGSALTKTLAAASRVPGHRRLQVAPLSLADVAELVRRESDREPDPGVVRGIHLRTAGNAFFVRELARLLADGDVRTMAVGVPATVRDVVRDRMSGLDERAGDLLQISALIGREVELSLLADVAGLDVGACLDHLGPVAALGLLEPTPGDPFSLRFSHDLVRESLTETMPAARAIPLHLRVADALERTGSSGDHAAERVAHHLWSAGPLADPAAPRRRWYARAVTRRPSPRSRPPSDTCDRPSTWPGRRIWRNWSCPPCPR